MGLFDLFAKNEGTSFAWKIIETEDSLREAIASSEGSTVAILKHSTRCGISASVKRQLEAKLLQKEAEKYQFYLVKVVEYRAISNALSEQFSVEHQSPQLLVIKEKAVQEHGSHYDILSMAI